MAQRGGWKTTYLYGLDARADFLHDAGELMAHDEAGGGLLVAAEDVQLAGGAGVLAFFLASDKLRLAELQCQSFQRRAFSAPAEAAAAGSCYAATPDKYSQQLRRRVSFRNGGGIRLTSRTAPCR
jgi:hypothetical protein